MTRTFPDGFAWGSGTAAYQVEGAWEADGKAPSIWDVATRAGQPLPDGSSGDVAIDQYHRLDGDLDLLRDLGTTAHRFSVSWPRVVTDASGTVNAAGLDYYERMVDGLLARSIAPALNLYHWDTPQWMEEHGGMLAREFADRFAEFASVLADRLGDRVAQWFTMNEPTHPSLGGYVAGFLAPNRALGAEGLVAVHHLLLAHGRAIQALRGATVAGEIGTILSLGGVAPATDHPDDVAAAARAEYFEGQLFLDPMLGRGHLPELAASLGDVIHDGDLETIAQPMDVLGVNWYSRYSAASPERAAAHFETVPARGAMFAGLAPVTAGLGFSIVPTPGVEWGGAHRQLTPGGFRHALDWLAETYPQHPDIVITENGVGYPERPGDDGVVHDEARIRYLEWALCELAEAIADGARIRGYHVWSSFDNLQWGAGFSQRFGLIHVDADTLERTPKDSFAWFQSLTATGVVPAAPPEGVSGDQVGVDVPGVRNARGIGGLRTVDGGTVRDGVLFRSAGLHHVTDDGLAALDALSIRTVLDLRGGAETSHSPDVVPFARVVHLPLHEPRGAGGAGGAGGADAAGPDDANNADAASAADAADGRGAAPPGRGSTTRAHKNHEIEAQPGPDHVRAVRELLASDGAVLAHCTAGKDRTGVLIAVVLGAIDVRDTDIVRTYAESEVRLGEGFHTEVVQMLGGEDAPKLSDEAVAAVLASPADLIVQTLAAIRREHGTVAAYLRAHGLTSEELARLREKLVA
ncbi:MAG: family 1 glycosylhydrolase [Pseudoclavibacter sp.]